MPRADAKRDGEASESAVIQRVDRLEPETGIDHADARVVEPLTPSADLPSVALPVVEVGTLVEIKSCAVVIGSSQRKGRFYLRRNQHQRLRSDAGVYLFAVTPPHDHDPITLKLVPASVVGDVIGSWVDVDGRATFMQIVWSDVFESGEVVGRAETAE